MPELLYAFVHEPPPFLRRALASVGAHVVVGHGASGSPLAYDRDLGGVPDLDRLIDATFGALARRTASSIGLSLTITGLEEFERIRLADDPPSVDDDEAGYWSEALKLGAFTGELLRQSNDGSWVRSESSAGSLPFVLLATFRGELVTVNPLGKALKYFDDVDAGAPSALVRTLQAAP